MCRGEHLMLFIFTDKYFPSAPKCFPVGIKQPRGTLAPESAHAGSVFLLKLANKTLAFPPPPRRGCCCLVRGVTFLGGLQASGCWSCGWRGELVLLPPGAQAHGAAWLLPMRTWKPGASL